MGEGVGAGVDMPLKRGVAGRQPRGEMLEAHLLGPMEVRRAGETVDLPPSRKVRALLAYLLVTPHAVPRSTLCELLWEGPDDPRAELRWCLSRIRSVIGGPERLVTLEDAVRLDLSDCSVDANDVSEAMRAGSDHIELARARELVARFRGDFLQGLEVDDSPHFSAWLTAQRHRFRDCHTELLRRLSSAAPGDEALDYAEQWRRLAPYDVKVHQMLLNGLARRGRVREAEEHLAAAVRLFEDEGLDCAPLHAAWQDARVLAAASFDGGASALAVDRAPEPDTIAGASRRASIAVMPFAELSTTPEVPGGVADALAYDVITRLAKLRNLFVIAQGTVFALKARGIGPEEGGRLLNVDYVISGSVRRDDGHLMVSIELIEARIGRVVWADVVKQRQADALLVLDDIGNRIVASIASEIEALERNRAVLKPPSSLDAWEAHHRALWHMYRFSKADNEKARHYFQTAVRLDPTFSRAYAGLSFTYFQSAFQGWAERAPAVERAFETAGQSMMADDRDPAAHWAMGRALWLAGRHHQSVGELEQAVELSPNFALGHYTLAFVHAQTGDPRAAITSSDYSRSLSPYDPLLFGMLGSRAMAHVRLGDFEEAARWAVQAAGRPNAHAHIQAIAAFSLALAGATDEALGYVSAIRHVKPQYTVTDFLSAFQFDEHGESMFRRGAQLIGLG